MGYFDREVKRIVLPTNPKYWVDVYTKLNWKEAKIFFDTSDGAKRTDELLPTIIADWNLTTGEEKQPIDYDHIQLLKSEDIGVLVNHVIEIANPPSDDQKKSSSKTPTKPSTAVEPQPGT